MVNDEKLRIVAASELGYNLSSVFLGLLLFRTIDKMTNEVQEEYFDPVLKRHVAFFVYLANCKLIQEYIENEKKENLK